MIDNLIGDFKRPKGAQYKLLNAEGHNATFSASPYERGMATTIGNSLRRVILSSLPGYAIVAIKFDKVTNEYENIPGVFEDTSIICLNLKKVAVALKDENIKTKIIHFDIDKKTTFTAGDIQAKDDGVVVGNPDQVIFSTEKDVKFSFDLQINFGRGYVPSEQIENSIEIRGTIPLDADYSPIKNCSFSVKNIKLGVLNDLEKLDLTIESKGTMPPEDALKNAAQILKECYMTYNELEGIEMTTAIKTDGPSESSEKDRIFHESVHELVLLIKSHYFMKVNGIQQIGQLVTKSEAYLRSKKRFDEEILQDVVERLKDKGLSLNMKGVNYVEQMEVS